MGGACCGKRQDRRELHVRRSGGRCFGQAGSRYQLDLRPARSAITPYWIFTKQGKYSKIDFAGANEGGILKQLAGQEFEEQVMEPDHRSELAYRFIASRHGSLR